ncbi:PfkB family carbohydrate kinase [cf. Phormidesmis sp. LEGE 11477]|uniref:PfkB family carbohydrate kinase n=1 Tax=cf. Phormidesmis sp. LEGE 11477 TaxID=1828680 RepID=UPI00187FA66A|nr:PfkB family carbohydrate kinase [cf. Phormidesmis sp. LEGE 11477]MBE9061061.1 sugar kinase [cf. Phormidesmis sp. LEGE 11477]
MSQPAGQHGLFVGVTTLDCIYQADHPPAANEKVLATKSLMVAGGPATNAAVTFAQLGSKNKATLAAVIGSHPLTGLMSEDLLGQGVTIADLDNQRLSPPPVSSIVVSANSGERAVISRSAEDIKVAADTVSSDILVGVDIVLIDGHQMAVSAQIAQWAKAKQIPIVVDAGSWKPEFESVLTLADAIVASANFFPPGCENTSEVIDWLKSYTAAKIAITQGSDPILFQDGETSGELEVPQIRAVDTLGAGDIFHGAFCHFYLAHTFAETLLKASRTASMACQYWGTRDWTKIYRMAEDTDDEETAN